MFVARGEQAGAADPWTWPWPTPTSPENDAVSPEEGLMPCSGVAVRREAGKRRRQATAATPYAARLGGLQTTGLSWTPQCSLILPVSLLPPPWPAPGRDLRYVFFSPDGPKRISKRADMIGSGRVPNCGQARNANVEHGHGASAARTSDRPTRPTG